MKSLETIRKFGFRNRDDDSESVSLLEREMSDLSVLDDGTGYKGNDGVYVRAYFTANGVYTVATNGYGINCDKGGMWVARYYNRNTAGYAKVLENCKADQMNLVGNDFAYPMRYGA